MDERPKLEQLVQNLKIGLTRYVMKTPQREYLKIDYARPSAAENVLDAWDNWVFGVSLYTNMNGEKSMRSIYYTNGLSAKRITNEWKLSLSADMSYNENYFEYDDTTAYRSISRSKSVSGMAVKSIDDHWSYGCYLGAYTSTYENMKFEADLSPTLEYNIYPYSESTRQQIRIQYRLTYSYHRYYEETVYDKTSEHLPGQRLSVSAEFKQPWGSLSAGVQGTNYFYDFNKKRLYLFLGLSFRVWEGLSLNIVGNASRFNDQISLRKGVISREEILLQRTQLETSYQYFVSFGLSYTFGSIFNNIVNPRFGETGGNTVTISY